MKKIIKLIAITAVDIIFIVLFVKWFTYLNEDYWFLRHENHPFMSAMMVIALIVFAAIVFIINFLLLRQALKKKPTLNIPLQEEEITEKDYTLYELLDVFKQVSLEKPGLNLLMEEAIEQVEMFQEDKEALKSVLKIQKIDYFPITNCVISTEEKLTRQMKGLLVDISVWNPKRLEEEDRKDSYLEIYNSIQHKLTISRENMNSFHQLLMRARTLKDEGYEGDTEIKNLIKALEMSKY